MTSKEILDKNAREILRKILFGESLANLQREYQVEKGTITDYYREIFAKDERALKLFNSVLEIKKKSSSTKEILDEELEMYTKQYIEGSLNLQEAGEKLGISSQTFQKKMFAMLSKNKELAKLYEAKVQRRMDYSQIDFRKLAVEMLERKCTQKQIEKEYQLKAKTFSKKINGFQKTKDANLYKACKFLAEEAMNRRTLTYREMDFINGVIVQYREKFGEEENEEKERSKRGRTFANDAKLFADEGRI